MYVARSHPSSVFLMIYNGIRIQVTLAGKNEFLIDKDEGLEAHEFCFLGFAL